MRKKRDPVSRMQDREKETVVELGSSSTTHRGKGTVEWHIDRSSEKCSMRGEQAKRCQENIQNVERSIAEHWGRENGYI